MRQGIPLLRAATVERLFRAANKKQIDTTYLKRGDRVKIARSAGVSKETVSQVVHGNTKSAHVQRTIEALNAARKKQEQEKIAKLCASIKEEATTDFNQPQ